MTPSLKWILLPTILLVLLVPCLDSLLNFEGNSIFVRYHYISLCTIFQDEMKQLARNERMAVHVSNFANLILFAAKVYASIESRSLAVIASTMDSFLDLLSGLILWFTSHAMRTPNHYRYPIGKKRMQPVVNPTVFLLP